MDQHANPRRRRPPLPSAEELGLPRLVDRDGIRCLPDAPKWWEDQLKTITPSNDTLLKLADQYPAPQEWYDEDFWRPEDQDPPLNAEEWKKAYEAALIGAKRLKGGET